MKFFDFFIYLFFEQYHQPCCQLDSIIKILIYKKGNHGDDVAFGILGIDYVGEIFEWWEILGLYLYKSRKDEIKKT